MGNAIFNVNAICNEMAEWDKKNVDTLLLAVCATIITQEPKCKPNVINGRTAGIVLMEKFLSGCHSGFMYQEISGAICDLLSGRDGDSYSVQELLNMDAEEYCNLVVEAIDGSYNDVPDPVFIAC